MVLESVGLMIEKVQESVAGHIAIGFFLSFNCRLDGCRNNEII